MKILTKATIEMKCQYRKMRVIRTGLYNKSIKKNQIQNAKYVMKIKLINIYMFIRFGLIFDSHIQSELTENIKKLGIVNKSTNPYLTRL